MMAYWYILSYCNVIKSYPISRYLYSCGVKPMLFLNILMK